MKKSMKLFIFACAASAMLFSSCRTTSQSDVSEPKTPVAPAVTQNEPVQPGDADNAEELNEQPENDDEELFGGNTNNIADIMLERQSLDPVRFWEMHKVQGDLSQANWSELEPILPVSVLKVAPDKDVIQSLESTFKLYCSAASSPKIADDQSTVQLIFCSKPTRPTRSLSYNQIDTYQLPRGHFCDFALKPDFENSHDPNQLCDECPGEFADVAYLSLVSPKDHYARIYQIDTEIDLGLVYGQCDDLIVTVDYSISDMKTLPFMGTTGLYVRTHVKSRYVTEHMGSGEENIIESSFTWLFAGDKHRLVTQWEDTRYEFERNHYELDEDDCAEEGAEEDGCMKVEATDKYIETSMYYRSGAFVPETKTDIAFTR